MGPDGKPVKWTAQTIGPRTDYGSADALSQRSRPTFTAAYEQPPRYFDGYEWRPASWSPNVIADLQRQMVDAGLITEDSRLQVGVWDETSRGAFTKLLGFANASGTTWEQALQRWSEMSAAFPQQGGPERPPLQVRLSNPDDLKRVFRTAVIDTLGAGWDDTKLTSLVNAYQALERHFQETEYNQAESGGTSVAPPDPTTFAMEKAVEADPVGAQASDFRDAASQFFDLVGRWGAEG